MNADVTRPYDPELPILAELESAFQQRLLGLETATPPAQDSAESVRSPERATEPAVSRPSARLRGHAERGRRVLRRAGLLAGVTGLVGASAFATRSLVVSDSSEGSDPSLRTTVATEVSSGSALGERWSLSASRRGRDLCDALIVDGAVATRCDRPPGAGGLLLDGLLSPRGRYLFGFAGPNVATVELQVRGARRQVRTEPIRVATANRSAGLPRGTRWFVVVLPRERRDDALAATATPRRADGRRAGPTRHL